MLNYMLNYIYIIEKMRNYNINVVTFSWYWLRTAIITNVQQIFSRAIKVFLEKIQRNTPIYIWSSIRFNENCHFYTRHIIIPVEYLSLQCASLIHSQCQRWLTWEMRSRLDDMLITDNAYRTSMRSPTSIILRSSRVLAQNTGHLPCRLISSSSSSVCSFA